MAWPERPTGLGAQHRRRRPEERCTALVQVFAGVVGMALTADTAIGRTPLTPGLVSDVLADVDAGTLAQLLELRIKAGLAALRGAAVEDPESSESALRACLKDQDAASTPSPPSSTSRSCAATAPSTSWSSSVPTSKTWSYDARATSCWAPRPTVPFQEPLAKLACAVSNHPPRFSSALSATSLPMILSLSIVTVSRRRSRHAL